ncbi:ribulose phosphate epimerase [Nonlabens spongiae]|uniref:Pseudouridine synthase n=2 Tax=Nonlabens spongiae TaxID=331648 RepID=A0A1W6MJC0_9FLAO|nr:ribulose phosphate epimerase [Nonlabens spongiae]
MLSQFTSNDEKQLRKKRFLGELYDFPEGVMAVGRLDENSEGLLLITTDGQWSNHVNKSGEFEKEYYAQLDGIPDEEILEQLRSGVKIGLNGKKYLTQPAKVARIDSPELPATLQRIRNDRHGPTSWISITITEGKYRQVRKMCSAVGLPVLRLARVRIGDYKLDMLMGTTVMEVEPYS